MSRKREGNEGSNDINCSLVRAHGNKLTSVITAQYLCHRTLVLAVHSKLVAFS